MARGVFFRPVHLVQFLLPVDDNEGRPFPRQLFDQVRTEMTDRFGGVTAFLQSPAVGLWKEDGEVQRDRMILFEVMVKQPNPEWWATYRVELEDRFGQDAIVIRALRMELL